MKRYAVLLTNLGGPLTQKDVRPFLFNLFSDKYIITLPFGLRHLVAGLISLTRAKSARANYALMGGGSPIVSETNRQLAALQARLQSDTDAEFKVFMGMRYWHPFIEDVALSIEAFQPDEVIVVPLYPQFSSTTTLSAMECFQAAYKGSGTLRYSCCYAQNQDFLRAHEALIKEALAEMPDPDRVRLIFSAHGLPEKIIKSGDPYQEQVEKTVSMIMDHLGQDLDHKLCYQSRVGPLKWIGPSLGEALSEAAKEDRDVVLIPIAFVSEHIETLVELDIEYHELAESLGIKAYKRVRALGDHPLYIKALGDEVMSLIDTKISLKGDHNCAQCHKLCPKRKGGFDV